MDEHLTTIQEHLFASQIFLSDTNISTDQLHQSVYAVISAAITTLLLLMDTKTNSKRKLNPERSLQRNAYLARLHCGSDSDCINMVRMNRQFFFKLCTLLRSRGVLVDTINVLIEEQVAMFLHTLGHSVRNRVIRFNFQRSGETVSRYFNVVLYAIGELRTKFIKTPSLETPSKIQSNPRFMPFFKDCIGAIDGTHIKARVPKEHVIAFRADWEGSAHDATVLKNALRRIDGFTVPEGKYYLDDGGYSTKKGFITPYRATRYHLREFNDIRPTNCKELFNLQHSSLRTTVERAFGSLKNWFTILKCDPYFPLRTQVDIVLACCILHNWILTEGGDELIISEDVWDSLIHGRTQFVDSLDDSCEWLQKRNHIANSMWERMSSAGY